MDGLSPSMIFANPNIDSCQVSLNQVVNTVSSSLLCFAVNGFLIEFPDGDNFFSMAVKLISYLQYFYILFNTFQINADTFNLKAWENKQWPQS